MVRSLTLAELVKGEHSSAEALETFRDYAESGAAISPHSVKAILGNVTLTPQEMDKAYDHMQAGMIDQISRGQGIAGLEYLQAMNYLAQMIAGSIDAGDSTSSKNGDPLSRIKSDLIMAHNHKSKLRLEGAIKAFQDYAIQINPEEFERGACTVNLTQPGMLGIFTKSYSLSRSGGSIAVYDYLMGIHATDNLDIVELEPNR